MPPPIILFIGDSQVEFNDWQARFPRFDVRNLGRAGETAGGLRKRLDRVLAVQPAPGAVCLMTGANNVVMEDFDFTDDLGESVARLAAVWPAARIVTHAVFPLTFDWIDPARIVDCNHRIEEIAAEMGAGFLNLFPHLADGGGHPLPACFLPDGVHLSRRGYRIWEDALEPFLTPS